VCFFILCGSTFCSISHFFLRPFSPETKKRSLWIQWFLRGKRRCVAPKRCLCVFFLLFPHHRGQSRTSAFFFPRTFLSDSYWSSLIGADIGLLSGEHADIHGHSRTFITMSSASLPFAFPQWKNVKNQELYGKDNSAADLSHAARSAHKSTTALSKSLLWYLPTNAIQRLTKKNIFFY